MFDQATKLAYCVAWVHMDRHAGVSEAYLAGKRALDTMAGRICPARTPSLPLGKVPLVSRSCGIATSISKSAARHTAMHVVSQNVHLPG